MAKYIVQFNPINADGKKQVLRIVTKRKIQKILAEYCFENSMGKPVKDLNCFGIEYYVTDSQLIEVKKTGRFQN